MQDISGYTRLYINQPLKDGASVHFDKEQSHYLKNVMRMEVGEYLRLFNGQDGEFLAQIDALSKNAVTANTVKKTREQESGKNQVHLVFALIKKQRLDFLIEKAVELGVTDLHPVITRRTENRKPNEDRLRAQVIEAAEQCERLDIPALHPVQDLPKKIGAWKGPAPILWCQERMDAPLLNTINQENWAFLIGPEGGFDEAEIDLLSQVKALRAVSLGKTIYRAETAALICLTIPLKSQ